MMRGRAWAALAAAILLIAESLPAEARGHSEGGRGGRGVSGGHARHWGSQTFASHRSVPPGGQSSGHVGHPSSYVNHPYGFQGIVTGMPAS